MGRLRATDHRPTWRRCPMSWASTSWRSRMRWRRTSSGRRSTSTASRSSCRLRRPRRRRLRRTRRERGGRLHREALPDHRPAERLLRHGSRDPAVGPQPASGRDRGRTTSCTRSSTRSSTPISMRSRRSTTSTRSVSDALFEDTPINPTKQREWFEMRRALVRLHRLVFSTREAVNALLRRDHDAIDDSLRPYFQDSLRPRDPRLGVDR